MKIATLCLLVRGEPVRELLLGYKKTGFGRGKYNGFGGKVEPRESILDAALRELREETGLTAAAQDVAEAGELTFHFPFRREYDMVVHVFLVRRWEGRLVESREMIPEWFAVENIPYGRMWADDIHWLPMVLGNRKVRGTFSFREDNETLDTVTLEHEA